jgi:hypothetical protein
LIYGPCGNVAKLTLFETRGLAYLLLPIAEAVTGMELGATVEEMMFTGLAHPTLSESLLDANGAVEGTAINT